MVVFYAPSTARSFRDGTPYLLSIAKDAKKYFPFKRFNSNQFCKTLSKLTNCSIFDFIIVFPKVLKVKNMRLIHKSNLSYLRFFSPCGPSDCVCAETVPRGRHRRMPQEGRKRTSTHSYRRVWWSLTQKNIFLSQITQY